MKIRSGKSFLEALGCNLRNSMITSKSKGQDSGCSSQQGDDTMATKINRVVMIHGEKRWIHANTEQEYADKLEKLFLGASTQKHVFKDYAWNWFELYSKPNIDATTEVTYQRQLRVHLIPAFGNMNLEDITTDDLQKFFNQMSGVKTTKDKAKLVLNMIFEAAIEDGFIVKNPLKSKRLKITGLSSSPTKEYTVEQMRTLVNGISKIEKPCDQRFLALIALHPLRLEEVLGLKWEDVDLETMSIYILRAVTHPDRNQPIIKETKTEQSQRVIALSSIAAKYLSEPGEASDFVIGGADPISYQQVKRMCERIQKDIGFEERITPIRFRTTVLTDIYDQTKDLKATQLAAGHSNVSTTLKHYVKGRGGDTKTTAAIDRIYGST